MTEIDVRARNKTVNAKRTYYGDLPTVDESILKNVVNQLELLRRVSSHISPQEVSGMSISSATPNFPMGNICIVVRLCKIVPISYGNAPA